MPFTPDVPVLDYGASPHRRIQKSYYLAWPVWAYRVVVPDFETSELDILERAVMRLCAAGVRRVRMSKLLNLAEELLQYIEQKLETAGLIENQTVTEEGWAVLRGDLERLTHAGRFQTGLIFQDPFSLEVWPYFADETPHAKVSFTPRPKVRRGPGQPRPLHFIQGEAPTPSVPTAQQIYRAYQRTKKSRNDPLEEENSSQRLSARNLSRARLVDPHPTPMYLLVELYVPEEEDVWYVTMPYESQAPFSPELKRALEARAERDEPLSHLIHRLVSSTVLPRSLDEQRARFRLSAQQNLGSLLDALDQAYPALRQVFEDCETGIVELENYDLVPNQKLDMINVVMRKVLEATLDALSDRYPLPPADELLNGTDPIADKNVLSNALATLGAASLSSRLSKLQKKEFKNWVKDKNQDKATQNIRAHLLAHVLFAARRSDHPFRSALQEETNILNEFDGLYEKFNVSAHHNHEQFTPKQINERARKLYQSVDLLLNLKSENIRRET